LQETDHCDATEGGTARSSVLLSIISLTLRVIVLIIVVLLGRKEVEPAADFKHRSAQYDGHFQSAETFLQ
jgi:hypothetical protein